MAELKVEEVQYTRVELFCGPQSNRVLTATPVTADPNKIRLSCPQNVQVTVHELRRFVETCIVEFAGDKDVPDDPIDAAQAKAESWNAMDPQSFIPAEAAKQIAIAALTAAASAKKTNGVVLVLYGDTHGNPLVTVGPFEDEGGAVAFWQETASKTYRSYEIVSAFTPEEYVRPQ